MKKLLILLIGLLAFLGANSQVIRPAYSLTLWDLTVLNNMTVAGTLTVDTLISTGGGSFADSVSMLSANLPTGGSVTNPTLNFGNGNTGFWEQSDDQVRWAFGGVEQFHFDVSGIFGGSTGNPFMIDEVASDTNPVWVFTGDTDTGLGRQGADAVSLTAGGVEAIRATESTTITGILYDDWNVTGKLGVGRIPTAYPFEVAGNIRAVSGHVLFSANYGVVDMIEAQYGFFPRDASDNLTIKTANTVRMLINSTGNVGINDVTPSEGTLTVGGTGYFSDILTTNGLVVKVYTTNVSNPPTDAELDAAFGTPATVGTGWSAIIDDNAGGVNIYRVVSSGTVWGIFTAVIAL